MTLLDRRERTHGDFATKSNFIQCLKANMRDCEGWDRLTDAQAEALDMIATKIGRILHGDGAHLDHWLDVAGYAELAAKAPA